MVCFSTLFRPEIISRQLRVWWKHHFLDISFTFLSISILVIHRYYCHSSEINKLAPGWPGMKSSMPSGKMNPPESKKISLMTHIGAHLEKIGKKSFWRQRDSNPQHKILAKVHDFRHGDPDHSATDPYMKIMTPLSYKSCLGWNPISLMETRFHDIPPWAWFGRPSYHI